MSPTNISTYLPPTARPPASPAPRVWAGAVMLVCSVVLVGLTGCFLIGVLVLVRPDHFLGRPNGVPSVPVSLSSEDWALMLTLYALASTSFVGAIVLFVRGLRVLRPLLCDDQLDSDN